MIWNWLEIYKRWLNAGAIPAHAAARADAWEEERSALDAKHEAMVLAHDKQRAQTVSEKP